MKLEVKNKIQEFREENKRISNITRDNKIFLLDNLYLEIRKYIINEFDYYTFESIEECVQIEDKETMELVLFEQREIFKEGVEFVWDYLKDMDCRADFYYVDGYGNFFNIDSSIIDEYLCVFEDYLKSEDN